MAIGYREALATSTKNPHAKWPERGEDNRLEPFANPSFKTRVQLQPGAKVMTMGSCFARNIEEYFAGEGFIVPVMGYSAPVEEYGEGGRIQGILNKYTLASIAHEIEWLAKVKNSGGKVTWENIEPMMFDAGNGQVVDLQLSSNIAVSRERAVERRQQIYDIHVQIFDCDLAVLTPGLTETWLDTKTGLYIQRMPRPKQAAAEPDRFAFEVMDFFQCFDMLEKLIKTLRDNGTNQIAMTVSPVPLQRTMTDKDVLIANTYSKATLRSAVGLVTDRYDFVSYVPSFEKVMLSKNNAVWQDDLRHVTDSFVGQIASTFAASTGVSLKMQTDDVAAFNAAFEEGELDQALSVLERIGDKAIDVGIFRFHKNVARLFTKSKKWEEALPHVQHAQRLRPNAVAVYKLEYRIHKRLGNEGAMRSAADRAVANCKDLSMEQFLAKSPD
jgi:hypothetical protein